MTTAGRAGPTSLGTRLTHIHTRQSSRIRMIHGIVTNQAVIWSGVSDTGKRVALLDAHHSSIRQQDDPISYRRLQGPRRDYYIAINRERCAALHQTLLGNYSLDLPSMCPDMLRCECDCQRTCTCTCTCTTRSTSAAVATHYYGFRSLLSSQFPCLFITQVPKNCIDTIRKWPVAAAAVDPNLTRGASGRSFAYSRKVRKDRRTDGRMGEIAFIFSTEMPHL